MDDIIFIGLDVHKATVCIAVAAGGRGGEVRQLGVFENRPEILSKVVSRLSKGGRRLSFCYEAGPCGYGLHRLLTGYGHECVVVAPSLIPIKAGDRVKTDRRDAKKLAIDLADGRLRGISIPTEAEELARLLPRTRAQIVEHRATIARQIKAKLHQFGLIAPSSRRMISNRYLREIASWSLAPELRVSLTLLAEQWRFATRQLIEIRRRLQEQAAAQAARGLGFPFLLTARKAGAPPP
jgi:transposase